MGRSEDRSLEELVETVREEHLVEEIDREGERVTLRAGGERFTLVGSAACEFLESILRVASHHPDPTKGSAPSRERGNGG